MTEETSGPRDVRIDEAQHGKYKELTEDSGSPFESLQKKDLFVFAMGYGFDQGLRKPIDGSTRALFNIDSLTEEQQWNIRAVAVNEQEDHEILRDKTAVYKIAREYANGGMDQLHNVYTRPGDFFGELSSELLAYGETRLEMEL